MQVDTMDQPVPSQPKLPAGLAGMLNDEPEENRDSAYFSGPDASSKHNSTASCISASPASTADKTPPPITTTMAPHSVASPGTASMSVASIVSPTTPASGDLRRFDRPLSLESGPLSASDMDSRRESVDSRFNQGFGDLRLGNSPYASQNHSTTSIPGTLPQQRPQRPGLDNLSVHRISNGYQPSVDRNPEPHPKIVRTAPAITGPATSTIARAAEPTKGQAWAFPEEDMVPRMPSGGPGQAPLFESRRSSVTDSLASSQYTSESRALPPGQRRLDDPDYRLSNASGEYPSVHHHSIGQHEQLGKLRAEESTSSQTGSQPYSRTPELRISHKLAERKRRTEMKELFDELRDLMPQERGSKASKWEILTKAIAEHRRQEHDINQFREELLKTQRMMEQMQADLQAMRMENMRLQHNLQAQQQLNGAAAAGQQPPPTPPGAVGVVGGAVHPPLPHHPAPPTQQRHPVGPPPPGPPEPYGNPAADPYARTPGPELPPLRLATSSASMNGGGASGDPEVMMGVEYNRPRTNGYQPPPY